jgi:hypothetical protein
MIFFVIIINTIQTYVKCVFQSLVLEKLEKLDDCFVCLNETTKSRPLIGITLNNCNHIICHECYNNIIVKGMCGARCPICRK